MLNVVIGLIFILLLLSLLATTIMELISGVFSFRGRHLERVLKNMLATESEEVLDKFKSNPLYKQLAGSFLGKKTPPSYINSSSFRSILLHELGGTQDIKSSLEKIGDENLKKVVGQLYQEAEGDLEEFVNKLEGWYDDVMDRASGWYKRNIQKVLVSVGLVIAILFNADTISIYNQLSKDPKARLEVATLAQQYSAQNSEAVLGAGGEKTSEALQAEINYLVNSEIENLRNPLGLGWDNFDAFTADWYSWLEKVLGWIVTALAISLGAPFWFDILKRLVHIRNSGNVPQSSTAKKS